MLFVLGIGAVVSMRAQDQAARPETSLPTLPPPTIAPTNPETASTPVALPPTVPEPPRQDFLEQPTAAPASSPVLPSWFDALPARGMGDGSDRKPIDYRATWYPQQPVSGQNTNLGFVRQDLSVRSPVWNDAVDVWSVNVHVSDESFQTGAMLANSDTPFPSDLWNIGVGASYFHEFGNGWVAGGSVNLGSASDRPFDALRDMNLSFMAQLRIPTVDRSGWLFSLAYSPMGEISFPLPGVAYVLWPSDCFRATIGLPFQLMWKPIDDLTLDFSYMLLTTVHARATYRIAEPVRFYVGFDWCNESFYLADREDTRERLWYFEKRLAAGVQANLGKHVVVDLSGGYAFDRFYFQGDSVSDQDQDRLDVGNGAFLAGSVRARW
jgi:hypothetical protein